MKKEMNRNKIEKYLWIGIVGAILSMAGDLFLGWYQLPELGGAYVNLIAGCAEISDLRYGLGASFGAFGIPISFIGLLALAELIECSNLKQADRSGKWLRIGAYAMAFWGAAVHLLCVALMYLVKVQCLNGFVPGSEIATVVPPYVLPFAIYVCAPTFVFLLIPYTIACLVLFISMISGKTALPRYACIFNPLIVKVLLNLMSKLQWNTCFFNGMRMSNMSFGALFTFVGILVLLIFSMVKN